MKNAFESDATVVIFGSRRVGKNENHRQNGGQNRANNPLKSAPHLQARFLLLNQILPLMNLVLETRKRTILEYLAELQDEAILGQIENLLRPSADIWDELNSKQKAAIRKGTEQLNSGQRIDYEAFMEKQSKPRQT